MRLKPLSLWICAALVAAGAAWRWLGDAAEPPEPVTVAARPVDAAGPASASAQAPLPSPAEPLPANILLVGTNTEPRNEAATFVIDGGVQTFGRGAHVAGSVDVIQRVTARSVWMGPPGAPAVREILVSPARDVAARMNEARQADAAQPGWSAPAQPAAHTVVQRGDEGAPLPEAQRVTVRRRERQPAGPVGGP